MQRPPMNSAITLLFSLLLTSSVVACSAIKNTEAMKDTTAHMAKTTDGMAKTTSALEKRTETIEGLTQNLKGHTQNLAERTERIETIAERLFQIASNTFYDLRMGTARELRRDSLQKMKNAETDSGKTLEAAVYFASFEFQVWHGNERDDRQMLDMLYAAAIEEFLLDVRQFYTDRQMDDAGIPLLIDENRRNLNALALAMEVINPAAIPQQITEAHEAKLVSLMDVLQYALAQKAALAQGKVSEADLPQFVREALIAEQDAIYVHRVRGNIVAGAVLAKLTDLDEPNRISNFFAGMRAGLRTALFPWSAPLVGKNSVQIREYAQWLRNGNATRDFLRTSLGVDPQTDGKIRRIFRNMRFSVLPQLSETATASERREQQLLHASISDFKCARLEFLADSDDGLPAACAFYSEPVTRLPLVVPAVTLAPKE